MLSFIMTNPTRECNMLMVPYMYGTPKDKQNKISEAGEE